MTTAQKERIEFLLHNLAKASDRLEARAERYEAAGDKERAARADRKDDEVLARIHGMYDVLSELGYAVKWTGDDGNSAILLDLHHD